MIDAVNGQRQVKLYGEVGVLCTIEYVPENDCYPVVAALGSKALSSLSAQYSSLQCHHIS